MATITKKRKKFFDVEIPLINKETQAQAFNLEELEGRFIKFDLTRILKGKSIEARFNIKIEGSGEKQKAIAHPIQFRLMPYYLKRMVRKGTNYVEDSFTSNCKDVKLKIKPFLVTRRKVSRAVRKALRNKAKEELLKYVKDKDAEELFDDIIKNKIQKTISLKLKKIYPLSMCEIRVLEILK